MKVRRFNVARQTTRSRGTRASCPVIQGENALSVYANESGGSGNFYLAKIDASYANHVLEVSLFDPGEGDKDIELDGARLAPSLATFLWETTDSCPGTVFGPPFAGAPIVPRTSDSSTSPPVRRVPSISRIV